MTEVAASDLVLGPLLAEGGEGRVFEVVSCPAEAQAGLVKGGGGATEKLVFKQFRRPVPLADMAAVARVPGSLVASDPGRGHRVLSCTAWPVAAVQGPRAGEAIGALMPRAPQRFWLRHRDGPLRLATLSYLTGDPDRIALAYGVTVPPPGSPARVALVYALCRAVEAWAAGD
ncbi:MAG TPA: hypothetical protein VK425_02610, partial [Acidimicrobiales bacterium]|nr:hypothetical protein [Acidimicrobiales bacterium]